MTDSESNPPMSERTPGLWPSCDLESVKSCPACGKSKPRPLFTGLRDNVFFCAPGKWDLHRCSFCGSVYLDPRPTESSIGRAYADYYTHEDLGGTESLFPYPSGRLAGLKHWLRNSYFAGFHGITLGPASPKIAWVVPLFFPFHKKAFSGLVRDLTLPHKGARLLDVGCGNGTFLEIAEKAGWEAHGLDPDQRAVDKVKRRGLRVELGRLPDAAFKSGSFDAVTLSHVLEHVHDPIRALAEAYRMLKPGGQLWICTPNVDSPMMRYFGRNSVALDPPRHLTLFSHRSLMLACTRAGITRSRIISPCPDTLKWWQASRHVEEAQLQDSRHYSPSRFEKLLFKLYAALSMLHPSYCEDAVVLSQKPFAAK